MNLNDFVREKSEPTRTGKIVAIGNEQTYIRVQLTTPMKCAGFEVDWLESPPRYWEHVPS